MTNFAPHFLIVGSPRSGTTLVQRLASELEGVAVTLETHFYALFYDRDLQRRTFPLSGTALDEVLDRFRSMPEHKDLELDDELVRRALPARTCDSPQRLFSAITSALAPGFGIVGEKTPNHLHWWRPISRAAPTTRFVFVLRDPRAVVASEMRVPFGMTRVPPIASRWTEDVAEIRRAIAALPAGRGLLLRFEDVVRDPEAARSALARLLGVPDRHHDLEDFRKGSSFLPGERSWKDKALGAVDPDRAEAWHHELTDRQRLQVEAIAGEAMAAMVYGGPDEVVVASAGGSDAGRPATAPSTPPSASPGASASRRARRRRGTGGRDRRVKRVLVIVPRRPSHTQAVDSQLLAAAQLANGFSGHADVGEVTVLTENGVAEPEALVATAVHENDGSVRRGVARLPASVRLGLADVQAVRRDARMRRRADADLNGSYDLVVQFHHRFQRIGRRLADRYGCPLVVRVEALEMAEKRDWGTSRRWTDPVVERVGERRVLRRADLVAPVSPALADHLIALGLSRSKVLVVANGIDVETAERPSDGVELPTRLTARFVVGWVGGFRAYHDLGQLADVLPLLEQKVSDATICLVGTGPERPALERLAARHPQSLVLLPPVAHRQVHGVLAQFDACLQISAPGGSQHYSPLKVLEYLACGRPVIAPDTRMTSFLTDGRTAVLYAPGDTEGLVSAVSRLHEDPDLRRRLGEQGREVAKSQGDWTSAAGRIMSALDQT